VALNWPFPYPLITRHPQHWTGVWYVPSPVYQIWVPIARSEDPYRRKHDSNPHRRLKSHAHLPCVNQLHSLPLCPNPPAQRRRRGERGSAPRWLVAVREECLRLEATHTTRGHPWPPRYDLSPRSYARTAMSPLYTLVSTRSSRVTHLHCCERDWVRAKVSGLQQRRWRAESVAAPQSARGWSNPPYKHCKIQSCCRLGFAFEVAASQKLWEGYIG
jgi:hypothetical protein